jgi:hypothetical protein
MSNQYIGVADQERESMEQHLASAERALSAFVTAVDQVFGVEKASRAANSWIEELERADWFSEAAIIDWRKVTIAAAGRLLDHDKRQRSRN